MFLFLTFGNCAWLQDKMFWKKKKGNDAIGHS